MQLSNGVQYILLAEDDEDDAELFTMAMQEVAPQVQTKVVKNEKDLMAALASRTPDLLFMDSILIHVKGTDCLAKIRSHQQYQSLPVIMYSGDINQTKIKEAFAAGANLYAAKPNSMQSLRLFIQQILGMDWSDLSQVKRLTYSNSTFKEAQE